MRSPRAVWEGCSEDERWLEDPVAVVTEIMREARESGFAAGVEASAQQIEREHVRLPQCPWSLPRALARTVRDLNRGAAAPCPHEIVQPAATAAAEEGAS